MSEPSRCQNLIEVRMAVCPRQRPHQKLRGLVDNVTGTVRGRVTPHVDGENGSDNADAISHRRRRAHVECTIDLGNDDDDDDPKVSAALVLRDIIRRVELQKEQEEIQMQIQIATFRQALGDQYRIWQKTCAAQLVTERKQRNIAVASTVNTIIDIACTGVEWRQRFAEFVDDECRDEWTTLLMVDKTVGGDELSDRDCHDYLMRKRGWTLAGVAPEPAMPVMEKLVPKIVRLQYPELTEIHRKTFKLFKHRICLLTGTEDTARRSELLATLTPLLLLRRIVLVSVAQAIDFCLRKSFRMAELIAQHGGSPPTHCIPKIIHKYLNSLKHEWHGFVIVDYPRTAAEVSAIEQHFSGRDPFMEDTKCGTLHIVRARQIKPIVELPNSSASFFSGFIRLKDIGRKMAGLHRDEINVIDFNRINRFYREHGLYRFVEYETVDSELVTTVLGTIDGQMEASKEVVEECSSLVDMASNLDGHLTLGKVLELVMQWEGLEDSYIGQLKEILGERRATLKSIVEFYAGCRTKFRTMLTTDRALEGALHEIRENISQNICQDLIEQHYWHDCTVKLHATTCDTLLRQRHEAFAELDAVHRHDFLSQTIATFRRNTLALYRGELIRGLRTLKFLIDFYNVTSIRVSAALLRVENEREGDQADSAEVFARMVQVYNVEVEAIVQVLQTKAPPKRQRQEEEARSASGDSQSSKELFLQAIYEESLSFHTKLEMIRERARQDVANFESYSATYSDVISASIESWHSDERTKADRIVAAMQTLIAADCPEWATQCVAPKRNDLKVLRGFVERMSEICPAGVMARNVFVDLFTRHCAIEGARLAIAVALLSLTKPMLFIDWRDFILILFDLDRFPTVPELRTMLAHFEQGRTFGECDLWFEQGMEHDDGQSVCQMISMMFKDPITSCFCHNSFLLALCKDTDHNYAFGRALSLFSDDISMFNVDYVDGENYFECYEQRRTFKRLERCMCANVARDIVEHVIMPSASQSVNARRCRAAIMPRQCADVQAERTLQLRKCLERKQLSPCCCQLSVAPPLFCTGTSPTKRYWLTSDALVLRVLKCGMPHIDYGAEKYDIAGGVRRIFADNADGGDGGQVLCHRIVGHPLMQHWLRSSLKFYTVDHSN